MARLAYSGENIKNSPFHYKTDLGYEFFFATRIRKMNFINNHEQHREDFSTKFLGQYGFNVELKHFADFIIYIKLETSGFYVINHNTKEVYEWQNYVQLTGDIKKLKRT